MRVAYWVVGHIPGTDLQWGDMVILGEGRAPRVIRTLEVDYGRLGMAMDEGALVAATPADAPDLRAAAAAPPCPLPQGLRLDPVESGRVLPFRARAEG